MAYLPGVPNMGPSPVSPVVGGSHTSVGAPKGIAAIAHQVGKPGYVEHHGSVVGRRSAGLTAVGGGNQAMHSMNHYGKKTPPLLAGSQLAGGNDPIAHPGIRMIRGGSGQMRSHIREGGLGPGRMSTPGQSDTDYSMSNNMDVE